LWSVADDKYTVQFRVHGNIFAALDDNKPCNPDYTCQATEEQQPLAIREGKSASENFGV